MKEKDSSHLGFTLIELLVVIAIIAILAAILFPVFAKVREKARQTTCLSNMKQIGLGLMQYVQDYDEYYPMSTVNISGGPHYEWTYAIDPYVKSGTAFTNSTGVQCYYNGVYACPSALREQTNQYVVRLDVFPTVYGTPLNSSNGSGPVVSMSRLTSPANAIGMWESGANGSSVTVKGKKIYTNNTTGVISDWWIWGAGTPNFVGATLDCDEPDGTDGGGWLSCNGWPRYRHQGMANMMYLDGHVKSLHKKDWFNTDFAQPGLNCEAYWWGC